MTTIYFSKASLGFAEYGLLGRIQTTFYKRGSWLGVFRQAHNANSYFFLHTNVFK